jgi:LPS sulfotransferase NodH
MNQHREVFFSPVNPATLRFSRKVTYNRKHGSEAKSRANFDSQEKKRCQENLTQFRQFWQLWF